MDRRDFMKGVGAAGGMVAGLTAMNGLAAGPAEAALFGGGNGTASRKAMQAILDAIREVETKILTAKNGFTDPVELAEAERTIGHILHTGLEFWLEADLDRPVFKQYVTPTRKLLGCNPDSLYYFAAIRPDKTYRITGSVGAATFTSFTVEEGSAEGHAARGSSAALGDDEMEIKSDGSYEIIASQTKPAKGNWLKLGPTSSQITTRHYHESRQCVATLPGRVIPISIEVLDPEPLKPNRGDAQYAERLQWVANFVREHSAMTFRKTSPEMAKALGWTSLVPNQFTPAGQWRGTAGQNAYGNMHAWYASANYELAPDEALVITGRFPECRFANVVLWNAFMQSYDYANRRISLNRNQIVYEKDGSYRIVVAHRDPGVPNWLDTEGRPKGHMYWRYLFPIGEPGKPDTRVVKVDSLA
ncbi:MAG: DUF1214 domain-containing protein [Myxococcota bacterium]